jgi:hypothetical protein
MRAFVKEITGGFSPDLQRVVAAYRAFVGETAAAGDADSAMQVLRDFARELCSKYYGAVRAQLPSLLAAPDVIEGLEMLWQDAVQLQDIMPETRATDGAQEVVLGVFRGRLEGALGPVITNLSRAPPPRRPVCGGG